MVDIIKVFKLEKKRHSQEAQGILNKIKIGPDEVALKAEIYVNDDGDAVRIDVIPDFHKYKAEIHDSDDNGKTLYLKPKTGYDVPEYWCCVDNFVGIQIISLNDNVAYDYISLYYTDLVRDKEYFQYCINYTTATVDCL